MSWAEITDNKVIRLISRPKPITVKGVQHPANIFSSWSRDELYNIGIVPYITQKDGDENFQSVEGIEYKIGDKKVIGITSYKDKSINDIKIKYISHITDEASTRLSKTDWYVIKHLELNTDIPSHIKTYRASVRAKHNELEASINACTSFDDFKELTALTHNDWPTLAEE